MMAMHGMLITILCYYYYYYYYYYHYLRCCCYYYYYYYYYYHLTYPCFTGPHEDPLIGMLGGG